MAEDIRHNDSDDRLTVALVAECRREGENCLYTSTTFLIWLRFLRFFRASLWGGAAVASAFAASHILTGDSDYKVIIAALALLGVVLPVIGRAVRLDELIADYTQSAGAFKNLQGEFRRAEQVWSLNGASEFEAEARRLFKVMNDARKPSRTPPEFCFELARAKIRSGHYEHDD